MIKAKLFDINGKEKGTVELPKCFSAKDREDLVAKVLDAKKRKQPYAPSPIAGNQASASGVINHRRHVWKTSYGRGMSRVPRKLMMSRGGQFHWVGATSPNTRGGRRAHPPRVESMTVFLKINKKEMRLALMSALSATINSEKICLKYSKVEKDLIKNIPAIIEKIDGIKAKNLSELIISVLGNSLYEIVLKKKSVRAGRGKMRGRKYKANAGILIVI